MSTPDQPVTPPLTRRQMREIRNTGATQVIPPNAVAPADDAQRVDEAPAAVVVEPQTSDPADAQPAEAQDADAQDPAEAQPEVDADAAAPAAADDEVTPAEVADAPSAGAEQPEAAPAVESPAPPAPVDLGVAPLTRRQAREHERIRTASVPIIAPDAHLSSGISDEGAAGAERGPISRPSAAVIENVPGGSDAEPTAQAVVNPHLGSGLLEGAPPVVELPPSFDQLITRNASSAGSSSTPNALILSQTPAAAPLVAPVTATGEVLITGSFDLPEGLGSVGHGPGVHDGKDVDAVLIDGELPASSSPTPIAASAAVSTVRTSDEIIRPPAPEKGSRLVLALAIAAGGLAAGLVAIVVLILTTGVL